MVQLRSRINAQEAHRASGSILERLEPFCDDIRFVGSLRRNKPTVGDIEFLCIPRFESGIVDLLDRGIKQLIAAEFFDYRPNINGSRVYGPQNKLLVHVPSGIGIDIFSTSHEKWFTALVVRTGGAETNKRIARAAIAKGWRFQAYGEGFLTPHGGIRCNSEREVFELVGLKYLEPWDRP